MFSEFVLVFIFLQRHHWLRENRYQTRPREPGRYLVSLITCTGHQLWEKAAAQPRHSATRSIANWKTKWRAAGRPRQYGDMAANATAGISNAQLETLGEAMMISGYINLCLLVCEIGMLTYGPRGETRHMLDTMAHILTGPISFLGFLNGGFTSSILFFLSLWHFMCDSGRARPSYLRVRPRTCEECWVWFESLWLLLHHWYIGTFKLLSTDLASQLEGLDLQTGNVRFLIRTWVLGATLSHLSFGMSALKMRGSTPARALSVVFRMGAAGAIVLTQSKMELRYAYGWDLTWMTVILGLTVRKEISAALQSKSIKTSPVGVGAAASYASDAGAAKPPPNPIISMEARLVARLRLQAENAKRDRAATMDIKDELVSRLSAGSPLFSA